MRAENNSRRTAQEKLPGGSRREKSCPETFPQCSMSAHRITYCPPAPQTVFFDQRQFAGQRNHAVSASFGRDDDGLFEVTGGGIGFEDYARMQTSNVKHGVGNERRFRTPAWVNDSKSLLLVVVNFLEKRAFSRTRLIEMSRGRIPSLKTRLRVAEDALRAKIPALEVVCDRLCGEYVALKQNGGYPIGGIPVPRESASVAERLRVLQSEIQALDTQIITSRTPGATITGILYMYYRLGINSVGVASELGLKSPHVRQTLFRLWDVAVSLGFDAPDRAQRKRDSEEERRERRQQKLLARAAVKAERERARELRIERLQNPKSDKARRAEWHAQGICGACGKTDARPGYRTCLKCYEANKKTNAEHAARKKAAVTAA